MLLGMKVIFPWRGLTADSIIADHCHPSPDPFLDEQMLINVREKIQLHVQHFKSSLPGQTRGSVIMCRIKTMMLEAHVPKILKHVGQ